MSKQKKKKPKKFYILQEKLQEILQLEVRLLREILSNLSLEEEATLVKDEKLKEMACEKNRLLLKDLHQLKGQRLILFRKIFQLFPSHHTFEELLSEQEETGCEIISLWDQHQTLSKKIKAHKPQTIQSRMLPEIEEKKKTQLTTVEDFEDDPITPSHKSTDDE